MSAKPSVASELDFIQESEPKLTIDDLCYATANYLESGQVDAIRRAYHFADNAHEGQTRRSGERYITHPLAVAHVLAMMHMDYECIMAGLLHDVIEDTALTKADLAAEFGEEVGELVEGVTKLAKAAFETQKHAQAENLRKMLLAMSRDIRVIIVKLADRLHNMRTLGHLRPEKRRRIANETLDIYAPIAQRLGMNLMRCELEDLGFHVLYPIRYRVLQDAVRKSRGNRKEIVTQITASILNRMEQEGLSADIQGREKNLYSLYKKMVSKQLSFSEVMDVYAFRIIVDDVDACYRMLGVVHNLYKPVQGKFKDYIAIPKANGYQSLHTVLFGPYGVPIEVQIRSRDMDHMAEAGVAAHWLYKTGESVGNNLAHRKARQWLQGILEMQKGSGDSMEFLENLRIDLFPDEIYVSTPKGEILTLPRGATAVDFAYAVHSDVGNNCVAARVGRHLVPLSSQLETGESVEIITSPASHPNPAWLNFVVTAKARTNIRNYLRHLQTEEAVLLGRRLLNKHLTAFSTNLDEIPVERFNELINEFELKQFDDLLEDIGLGNHSALLIAQKLVHESTPDTEAQALMIAGTEGMVVSFARCCHPIPGDPIHGYVSSGRGIIIHQRGCKNTSHLRVQNEKWLDVAWSPDVSRDFPVDIMIHVKNQRGVLATIAAVVSESDSNIDNVVVDERDGGYSDLRLTIEVANRQHLARVIRRLRRLDMVERITRIN
ncbi:MAG: bifunctional (p)ppGpp synthetase/guanosine-3',5'-bis(diphosphate) 3'-pyrophosphohydrolase [Pseudomonadota bacterium]|uniref:guanosine-3',5'-bis(diphosphate) 3'-diphosphatase n=2 Tax=Methylophaga TaxID=40222 RepID=F5T2I1_9GAMM|nr:MULTISPECIES: bifunctional (p)ppGpp synthetase/guanosine-3',5'-bis(diphosphate) 3'-pyrophosphohydrolase [Methylophaga]EGL53527.1 guanosine polyphosphate pyrophosphohydrolase/synthetase [Methylophaga aminisulfidivorans MP]MEC9413852.1 bifunctional (p)ppGpp synthetase/guanosine-3',5'-bis(diphosphate) 3'-pyrophosphohydrolase [Pseudomonadota bacterium]GLP99987.1 guanosine-3',5'-bis(diphosphate) 3'-pyrophosphohydrolase [Methylophaga thalassica]